MKCIDCGGKIIKMIGEYKSEGIINLSEIPYYICINIRCPKSVVPIPEEELNDFRD